VTSPEERIAALDAKIDALREKRRRLKKKAEERRAKHQSTAEQEMRLRGLTLQQLRAELSMERRRFTRTKLRQRVGRAADRSRERAAVIAVAIEQRQTEHA
jgi:hypothetical protein